MNLFRRQARKNGRHLQERAKILSRQLAQEPAPGATRQEIYHWIRHNIACFQEWYQPVDFGNGVVAHLTRPPDWTPRPELLRANDEALSKWPYIVKKHIPNLEGKRVLDLGCNAGLFCIEMAKLGASEVIGIDRNSTIRYRSTTVPPPQDVISQARFVKRAFELLDGSEYPINYIAHDIGKLEELALGRFDFVIALCVVYHELDKMPHLLRCLSRLTDHLVLQASYAHSGDLGKWASPACHAELLLQSGFTYVEIDAPNEYSLPMVIGRKGSCTRR